jgi:hypothetical protein
MYKRHYGAGGDPLILVAHGASRTLNPSLPQRVVDRALEKDHTRATAEYLAEFRTDVEGFVTLEVVESCVGGHRVPDPAKNLSGRRAGAEGLHQGCGISARRRATIALFGSVSGSSTVK